jgi:hypothetical protein
MLSDKAAFNLSAKRKMKADLLKETEGTQKQRRQWKANSLMNPL